MKHRLPARMLFLPTLGLALIAAFAFGPWAQANPEAAPIQLSAAPEALLPISVEPPTAVVAEPLLPIRWERDAQATRVYLDGTVLFRFQGDDGTLAQRVVQRLTALKREGALRSDRITPGRHGGRYAVNVGGSPLLEIDDAFASKQGSRAGALTLSYVNALRDHLGGVPIQVQASRGLLPGARSGIGMASWYGALFHGRRAASGERFDMHAHTAAHKTLPFGTLLLVTNLANGKTTLVRITDRGPYAHGRTLDLSRAAADALDMVRSGVARVRYTILM